MMHQSILKNLNNIVNITVNGDYEAHSDSEGNLKMNIGAYDNTSIMYATLPGLEDIHMFTNCNMLIKYLDLFQDPVDIKTSENAILVFNDKMEALIPMVSPENAKKTTKVIKKIPVYDNALECMISMDVLKTSFKASTKQKDMIIKFQMGDYLKISVGNVKIKLKDIIGNPYEWCLKYDVIERLVAHSGSDVKFVLPYNITYPVKIEYTSGPISVLAYTMRFFPEEPKEDGEKQ
jgi:hypothetical protein